MKSNNMINIRIHIASEHEYFDKTVFVDCKMPSVPRVGEIIHLTEKLQSELERKCTESDTIDDYSPRYCYGRNKDRLSFDDCVFVKAVRYIPYENKVSVTLGDYDAK